MADVAKKKLLTSKGVILSGEELPDNLPAKEVEAIRAAGGIEEQRAASSRKSGKQKQSKPAPIAAELSEAEQAVADAKQKVTEAGDDLAKKASAEQELSEAEAELARLKD